MSLVDRPDMKSIAGFQSRDTFNAWWSSPNEMQLLDQVNYVFTGY